jgi:tRNA(fMet)-specific endonuclease VapC
MKYLLDTNICIYIIKKKPEVVLKKNKRFPLGNIGISTITLAELQFGIYKSTNPEKNLNALNQFIIPLKIIDFDYKATIEYGLIRADLEKKETPIGPLDTLIGAHARSAGLTIITNNEKEFNRIPNLSIENWTKE